MSVTAATDNNTVKIDPPNPIEIQKTNPEPQSFKTETIAQTVTTQTNLNDREFAGTVVKDRLSSTYQANQNNEVYLPVVVNNAQQADPQKVDAAVKTIKDSLDQGFTDWDVTHGDLENIQKAFKSLNPAEANQVFDRLSNDDINNWTQELNGLNGGFSNTEKQELFNELAGKLSGENMAQLAKSFGDGNEQDLQRIGEAVGNNASSQTKVEFVQNMAGSISRTDDGAANAIAATIAGMGNDPAAIDRAIGSLTDSQLSTLMDEITIDGTASPYGSYTQDYDGKLLGDMLSAVSNSNNAEVKARVFNIAADRLGKIENAPNFMPSNAIIGKNGAADDIRKGLTDILNSDTTGIMNQLTYDPDYRGGEGLTSYLKSALKDGETEQIGTLIAKLAKGNDLSGNQLDRFREFTLDADGNKVYQNAEMLGSFTGSLLAANKQISNDVSKQADLLKDVLKTTAGLVGVEGVGSFAFEQTLNQVTESIVNDINSGRTGDIGKLIELTFPELAGSDDFYKSRNFDQYEDKVIDVLVNNLVK